MGQCIQKGMKAPVLGTEVLSADDVNTILRGYVGNDATIINWDGDYQTIESEDVKNFVKYNANLQYIINRYDCDDFSISLCARVREWVHDAPGSSGVCFGILTGDLRFKPEDPLRAHAVCFFIDSQKKLWICDGMWNDVYEYKRDTFTTWQIVL